MSTSIFQTYRDRLVDLSTKNKSLYLSKTESSGIFDIKELDFLNGVNSFEIIRQAISSKKAISLIPESDPRIASVNIISKTFSRLSFRDQLTKEETGEQSLFLGWPFVEGKLINGQILRAPLLLLGVKLQLENGHWILSKTDQWQWNSAFLLAYGRGYGKAFDEEFLNEVLQELSTDATEFRTGFSKLLNDNWSIQLNSSIFEDQLTHFPISQLSLDSNNFQEGKLVLKSYALLGQFAQKDSFLFTDYENLEKRFGEKSLEELLTAHFLNIENKAIPREEQVFPVFPIDASQENILLKVRQGKSVVVEGPPGTGKSQLIANLVSDYCSRGKKVLVVSQKRAALDVVVERLGSAGFGDFLGLVHDFRADQKNLFQKLKTQIGRIESYEEQNRGIDSIHLEREMSQYSQTISRLSDKFEILRTALFEDDSAGISIKAMYLSANLNKPVFEDAALSKLDYHSANEFEKSYKIYHSYQRLFKETFWDNRISFSHFEPAAFPRISQCLKEIESFRSNWIVDDSKVDFQNLTQLILSKADFSENLDELNISLLQLEKPDLAIKASFDSDLFDKLTKVQKWIYQALDKLNTLSFGICASTENLSQLELELDFLESKVSSWWGRIHLKISNNKVPLTVGILEGQKLKFDVDTISDVRSELETLKTLKQELAKLPLLDRMEFRELSIHLLQEQLECLNPVRDWVLNWRTREDVHMLVNWNFNDFDSQFDTLFRFYKSFQSSSTTWKAYLSDAQILEILKNGIPDFGGDFQLNQIYSELVGFDRFQQRLDYNLLTLSKKLETGYPQLDFLNQVLVFWNSWYLDWIAHLESKTSILAEAGSLTMHHELDELKTAILEKRKISKHIALLRLREQITNKLKFNRLGNRITYRELLHQVSKKRQRWSIRKLIEDMGGEVFRLLPCWFASPETVSGLFPLSQEFDLVIFDEASQCQVERGLPAMLRGKQVVIAGDSKQLRPSDFYHVRWESDEKGLEHEAESLLELASNFFEEHQLKGHYRSADPVLIHFSNTHFYDSQLETLPDYATYISGQPAFTWEKVEGIWSNRVNITEADAVVLKVSLILKVSPSDTIGIVTGNYFQMELIREKLWKAGFQDAQIKVRNIESVQGDEFDQVILSLGYAANPEGRLVTNFGLLGRSGAENRLNVAITRARKMMHVISSIDQDDFRSSHLKNPGLALLREFLIFAKEQTIRPSILSPDAKMGDYQVNWSLKNYLNDHDEAYSKEVPSAIMDLVLKESTGEKIAILTDDQRFFNAHTAKAGLGYHPILLDQKGWNYQWKWSRESILI